MVFIAACTRCVDGVGQLIWSCLGLLRRKVGRGGSPTPDRDFPGSSDDESADGQRISWDPQDIGDASSHTEYFRTIRDNRMERFLVETNKLIIRLDKLAHDAPLDARQRAGDLIYPILDLLACSARYRLMVF